jgi:tetratricopeptide (TPR) repeat protein
VSPLATPRTARRGVGSAALVLTLGASAWANFTLEHAIADYERGAYGSASEMLTEASRNAPRDAKLRLWLGKTLLKLRRWDDAVRELEAAASLQPDSSLLHLWLGRAYGEKASHASKLSAFGLARKVRQEFETAVRLDPENLSARSDLFEFYLEAPGLVGGGRGKAEAEAKEIAARRRTSGFYAWARLYARDKNWAQARAEYERARAEAPREAEPYLRLAEFLLERGEHSEARANAERALAVQPGNRQGKLLQAAARVELRTDLAEAEKGLAELAAGPLGDDDPSFAEVHYWLGRVLGARSKTAAAGAAYRKALEFDPDFERAKHALAALHP